MNKKQVKFIVLLTISAFMIWLVGELIIGLLLDLKGICSVVWIIIAVVATCTISVVHSFKND